MFEVVLTSIYIGYFGILFVYLKIISNNITREPIMEIENYNNLNILIKDNRFKLDNYKKKNELFNYKVKRWHKKLKCIKFNEYVEIYEIPNGYEF